MSFMDELPKWKQKRLEREHSGLRAKIVETGWWIFRRGEWQVVCSCGWEDPRRIPRVPVEIGLAESYLIRAACEDHLRDAADKMRRFRR